MSETSDRATAVSPGTQEVAAAGGGQVLRGRHNGRKVREGVVSSTKMDKTVIVTVVSRVRHPLYRKTLQQTSKLYVHDERNECRVGDRVRVQETRPLSKLKRWRLVEILERAK
jgi:small subunit ribosomal protein S17